MDWLKGFVCNVGFCGFVNVETSVSPINAFQSDVPQVLVSSVYGPVTVFLVVVIVVGAVFLWRKRKEVKLVELFR